MAEADAGSAVRAAVLREADGAFGIEELRLDPPGPGEVLVRIVAVGVCHTDASVRSRELPTPLPVVLGHEGSGVVEAVGAGVSKVVAGDHVVLTFQSCGACEGCLTGHPASCDGSFPLNFTGARPDGSHALHDPAGGPLHDRFFAQSSFATRAIATERNVVKVPQEAPLELLGPLGCGIQTGAGSVLNALKVEAGETIAVFGAGAVGLSAIMAARVAAAGTIIAVDLVPERLALARELGATHVIDAHNGGVLEAIRAIVPNGLHYTLDTTGNVAVIRTAVDALAPRGTCGIVGATAAGVELKLDTIGFMSTAKTLRGIVEGDSVPDIFIPRLIALYTAGRFPFDRLIRFYKLEELGRAFADSATGVTIKPVVRMS
jgi:aryl-alcohol dehydrogenase